MTSTAPEAQQGQDAGEQHGEKPPSWQQRLRRFGHPATGTRGSAPEVPGTPGTPGAPGIRDRLVPPYTEPSGRLWSTLGVPPVLADRIVRWSAWGGPLLVTLFAGVLRFWNLGSPKAVIFDETYYAKDAWALVHRGFEVNWDKNANDLILSSGGPVSYTHLTLPTKA